jgi:hypothetical protein
MSCCQTREVQFQVDHSCPVSATGMKHEPFSVWVFWPPITRAVDDPLTCGLEPYFLLTAEGIAEFTRRGWRVPDLSASHVCSHMGRVIE